MEFDNDKVKKQIDSALKIVKNVLVNSKKPKDASTVFHQYSDKFDLVDLLTNVAIVAQYNCLSFLGIENIDTLKKWNQAGSSCTLRFQATEKCTFVRVEERKEDTSSSSVSTSGIFGSWSITAKETKKVKYYYWKYEIEYDLYIYPGNRPEEKELLANKKGVCELMTVGSDQPPFPEVRVVSPIDLNLTWLLQAINPESNSSKFSVDRAHEKCHTPRRNPDVTKALDFFRNTFQWAQSVENYFHNEVFLINPINEKNRPDTKNVNDDTIFVPVIPIFEDSKKKKKEKDEKLIEGETKPDAPVNKGPVSLGFNSDSSPQLLQTSDYVLCLLEQFRTYNAKMEDLKKMFPVKDDKKFLSFADASLVAKVMHLKKICIYYNNSVDYVEHMLRTQLIAAIGKEVNSSDFTNYMLFHNRKLFRPEFEPVPFSYAVRLPEHYPEGIIGIDFQLTGDGSIPEPIQTTVRRTVAKQPMHFALNAATNVSFYGDRFLHAYVGHQFSKSTGVSLKLTARARQFSSFILLLGRISSADVFDPEYATIVQNKDDFEIPLFLETIPTPKEFKQKIWSLSPEQQRFAKAYRSLQLASTLFGICVIQIKPQMEKLLKLPYDSLTKEIRMTQQLMDLFIQYQIPSDLLTCDLENMEAASATDKLEVVRKYIESMRDMIKTLKQEEIDKKKKERNFQQQQVLLDQNVIVQSQSYALKNECDDEEGGFYSDEECDEECDDDCDDDDDDGRAPVRQSHLSRRNSGPVSNSVALSVPTPTTTTTTTTTTTSPPEKAPFKGVEKVEFGVTNEDPNKKLVVDTNSLPVQLEEPDEDVSLLPVLLNDKFEALDSDSALRPTIINVGKTWKKRSFKSILAQVEEKELNGDDLDKEKDKAYDLLDALSRSGCLSFDHASLHVVVASTHCFDKTLMDTVIQSNVNPIEKVERSTLIVATTVHNLPAAELVKAEQLERVSTYSPLLFAPKEDVISAKTKKIRAKK